MDIYVACDICGHRYVLKEDKEGRRSKCKSCGVGFEVSEENFYDPKEPEKDDDDEEEEPSQFQLFPILKLVASAIVTLMLLGWMATLMYFSPSEYAHAIAMSAPTANGLRNNNQTMPQPQFRVQPQRPNIPTPVFPNSPNIPGSSPSLPSPPNPNQAHANRTNPQPMPSVPNPGIPNPGFPNVQPPNFQPPNFQPPNFPNPPQFPGPPKIGPPQRGPNNNRPGK